MLLQPANPGTGSVDFGVSAKLLPANPSIEIAKVMIVFFMIFGFI